MAPPAGTSSMLRSRRRDATLKPNRTLDRSASRGMLYENEELRLRTININAEVEKGQSYIKKLRRENEQLKREIWNLREEYERLENYVKSQDQSEEEVEDECDGVGGEEEIATQPTAAEPTTAMVLETVVEEDDASADLQRQQDTAIAGNATPAAVNNVDVTVGGVDSDNSDAVAVPAGDAAAAAVDTGPATAEEGRAAACTGLVTLTADELAGGGRDDDDDAGGECGGQQHHHYGRLDVYDYNCAADDDEGGGSGGGQQRCGSRPHPDEAVLQPHTVCFDTGSNRQLHDLTVDEVVNAIQDAELRDKLRTVSLTDDRCYMTFGNAECLERALHTAVLRIRDVSVLLMDTGAGAVILSLTGVPDTVADKDVLKCLKRYGTIIGGVERKTGRGGTTGGERYVRIRPTLGAPRYLWFGSDKVVVRQLTEHETGTMNSVARRKSFRSHIKLNLKMADAHRAASVAIAAGPLSSSSLSSTGEARENCSGGGGGVSVGPTTAAAVSTATTTVTTAATAVSAQNGFRFPLQDPKAATGGVGGVIPAAESCKTSVAAATGTAAATPSCTVAGKPVTGGSMKRTKPAAAAGTTDGGCPSQPPASASSVGPAESSPLRGRRRPSLMGFRRETIKHRGGSVSRADGGLGEDADSDTSPICRRKLSIKGHERAEKVPWCGCWGNGCL